MRLIIRKTLLMFLLLSLSNVLTGFQLSAQEQNKKFSVKADNVTLKEAIEVVRKQGNYSFLIRNNDIDLNKKVSVNVDKGTINDVMAQLLTGTGISYEVNGNRVVIFHAAVPEKEQGKAFVLKGKVTDPSGEGVIGANVKVLNSTEGTITDMDGNFSLSVTPNARLSVSYIGYATQEVVVKNQTPLHIALKEDSRLIDEVVVVGYGVQKKANLTGAVSSVKMDEVLGDRPVVSVSDALKGAMPGLQITGNSGRPGEEMSFNIRGVNSLDKNGKPLVLVDNVEMDINMLDPNDIESVTVLKDAASSAIYGARAAFGVILITTKKGSDSTRLSINYSNNFSFSRPANMPRKATPLQTVQAYKDMGTINYQSGQNVDTWLDLLKEYNANPSAYPDGYAMVDGLRYSLAETNLFDDMMETGFQQTHNLSVGGGTKDISYRFSFCMVDENGVLASDKDAYKRYNVSSYIRSDVFSWITPELDIKYTNSKSELPETSGGYGIWGAAVAFPSYFPIGTMNIDGEELPINTPRNLINLAYPTTIQKNNIRIFGKVTITPLKNVKLVGEYTYNHLSNEKTKFEKKFYYAHGGNFVKETSTANSKYENSNGITDYKALNFYGNYNTTWGKHEVTVMGGFNQESSDYRYAEMSRMNMINEDLPSISQATGDYFAKDKFERYTVRGLFYRINYSFAGKYLIETNGRYDGSSKFPKDSRFGFFPSVSAGWRVSEEAFMKPLTSVLSNLKLRASWGNIGNQSITPYAYIPGMDAEQAYWTVSGIKVTTLKPAALVSNSFTWEKVTTVDVGFDLGLFNDVVSLQVDIFKEKRDGILITRKTVPVLAGFSGASIPVGNLGKAENKGIETALEVKKRVANGLFYSLRGNFSFARNKIIENDEPKPKYEYQDARGRRIDQTFGLVALGFFKDQDDIKNSPKQTFQSTVRPGDIKYKDINGDGVVDEYDKVAIGDPRTPEIMFGFGGTVAYKNFDVSLFFTGAAKTSFFLEGATVYPFLNGEGTWNVLREVYDNRWTSETAATAKYPIVLNANSYNNYQTSTMYMRNGSYLRLKSAEIGYTFKGRLIDKMFMDNIRLFCNGQNLLTLDYIKIVDPESNNGVGNYPMQRTINFGFQINFK